MHETKTVLVVDDEEDIRKSIGRMLLGQGYDVYTARDGVEALEKVRDWDEIDLVILDVMMPNLDGYEVLRQLRKNFQSQVPVIMLSARSTEMDVVDGYIKGADFYLTKPFETQMLLDAVAHYVGDLPMRKREQFDKAMLGDANTK